MNRGRFVCAHKKTNQVDFSSLAWDNSIQTPEIVVAPHQQNIYITRVCGCNTHKYTCPSLLCHEIFDLHPPFTHTNTRYRHASTSAVYKKVLLHLIYVSIMKNKNAALFASVFTPRCSLLLVIVWGDPQTCITSRCFFFFA